MGTITLQATPWGLSLNGSGNLSKAAVPSDFPVAEISDLGGSPKRTDTHSTSRPRSPLNDLVVDAMVPLQNRRRSLGEGQRPQTSWLQKRLAGRNHQSMVHSIAEGEG